MIKSAPIQYTDYAAGDSTLMAVFDRTSSQVPSNSSTNAGIVPSLPNVQFGYADGAQSSASILNGTMQQTTLKVNHVLQNGIPLWNATTTYGQGAFVQAPDSNGVNQGYYSTIASNLNHAPADNAGIWEQFTNTEFNRFNTDWPIGSVRQMANTMPPPWQGKMGVRWELANADYALVTGNSINVGTSGGINSIANGSTDGTGLTADQNGEHSHAGRLGGTKGDAGTSCLEVTNAPPNSFSQEMTKSGKGLPHDHKISAKVVYYMTYVRVS